MSEARLLCLAIVAAACKGGTPPPREPIATPPPVAAAPAPAPSPSAPTISITGCVREVTAVPAPLPAGRAIRVAVLFRKDLEETSIRNSATLAMEEWNKLGGVLGKHPIEVKFYDEGNTVETGLVAIKTALADGADMIAGGLVSGAGPPMSRP